MVLCMKLISFAWSAYDGARPIADLDATQRGSRIAEVPGLVPFLGYWYVVSQGEAESANPLRSSFFFPSILAGPSFTYASYENFTSRGLFLKEVKGKSTMDVIPPGRRRKASKRLLTGVFFLAIYSLYGAAMDYRNMLAPGFSSNSFGYRCALRLSRESSD
jgi:lysophospholipid acyltransferase